MASPAAPAGGSAPADATETATICHLAGTLTASECAGDWFYAAEGERWPFRLAVLDERDTGVDERTLLLRGSFEHAGGIADDDLELTICNNDVSGSGSSRFGAYTVVGTVRDGSVELRKLKDVLPKKRRRRSTKKVEEDASRELDRPAKRKKKQKKLAARKPPAEGAQLLVKWAGDDGSTREDGRYACVLRGGQLYGDWEEPVPFDPDDVATRVESNFGRPTPSTRRCPRGRVGSMAWKNLTHWLISTQDDWRYCEGAYKQRALDFVARFCAKLPPPPKEPKKRRSAKEVPPVEAIGDLVAEMAEFVADNAPEDIQNAYACSLHPAEYLRRWARGDSLLRPLRGLNVQHPWAPMLLDGSKVIEARTYDIDDKGGFGNEWFWVVETPGKQRQRGQRARITGCVKFCREAVRYTSLDQWRADEDKHRIAAGSDYDWDGRGAMYGWRVERVMVLREPVPGPDRKGTINSKPVPRLVPRDGWVPA